MRPLVIVRPEPGASATAKAARQLGLEPVAMPLFEVRPVAWEPPAAGGFDALLFTSANAMRHGGESLDRLRPLPAHCVGEATAQAARETGFQVASIGSAGVGSLLRSLSGDLRLLHLCGLHRQEGSASRQDVTAIPVYRADEKPPPDDFDRIEGCVVALHSPRAAGRVARLVDELGLARSRIALAAISSEAAEAAGTGWEAVVAADEPGDTALLAIAAELCNNRG